MENRDTRKSKLVFDMRVCRKLIHAGCNVIDCKPLKTDRSKTVLVFEDNEFFQNTLEKITLEYKNKNNEEPIEMAD